MNASERLVADVLDELHVHWDYEPDLFILRADEDGHPKEGFKPDFYLPKYDMYIEVTMAKVITAKNRKVRLAKEVHNVTVVILSKDDFRNGLKERVLEILGCRRLELLDQP